MAAEDEPQVKLSRSGICHEKGTELYARTRQFEPYDSVQACIAAGGRLPRPSPFSEQSDGSQHDLQPVLDAPATVQSDGPSSRRASDLLDLGGGAILLIGGIAARKRWRDRARYRGQEAAAKRRWEEHRLGGADGRSRRA